MNRAKRSLVIAFLACVILQPELSTAELSLRCARRIVRYQRLVDRAQDRCSRAIEVAASVRADVGTVQAQMDAETDIVKKARIRRRLSTVIRKAQRREAFAEVRCNRVISRSALLAKTVSVCGGSIPATTARL